jgi:hypothetical protein|tara:strand:+ start:95 stop:268 length:174 start_codon:yes stop_codon:yes gene_type:complete
MKNRPKTAKNGAKVSKKPLDKRFWAQLDIITGSGAIRNIIYGIRICGYVKLLCKSVM